MYAVGPSALHKLHTSQKPADRFAPRTLLFVDVDHQQRVSVSVGRMLVHNHANAIVVAVAVTPARPRANFLLHVVLLR